MVIEAWTAGGRLTYREIPDEQLWGLPGVPWKNNVEYRESVIRRELDRLKEDINKIFHRSASVEYRLIFQSKFCDETDSPL